MTSCNIKENCFLEGYSALNPPKPEDIFANEQEREAHYALIRKAYALSPSNANTEVEFDIRHGVCKITHSVNEKMYNTAQVMHGMYFFKLIDEAAHGAAISVVTEAGLATTNLSMNLIRPATEGIITAYGRLVSFGKKQYIGEAVIYNEAGKVMGSGQATFMKSKTLTERFKQKHQ